MEQWNSFITSNVASEESKESYLGMQMLMDRMMKLLIKSQVKEVSERSSMASCQPMNDMESNAIRYMAGYVAVKLLKKYRKAAKHPRLQMKRRLFVTVLVDMRANNQPGDPDSPLEYTKVWTELIDRGGLYHISDDVFNLVQNIEAFVRRHMNTETLTSQSSSNLKPLIREELFSCHQLISLWDKIAHSIPHKYEKYSLELLGIIADLWITIRGHSFAKNFTMQFVKKYTKGTRKTLKA